VIAVATSAVAMVLAVTGVVMVCAVTSMIARAVPKAAVAIRA
jgi:hypothetical protein